MASLDDVIRLVGQIREEYEDLEWDQISWRLNDRLRKQGVDPAPAYVEMIRRGLNWYVVPLYWLGSLTPAAALGVLSADRIDPWVLEYLLKSPANVPAFAAILSRKLDEALGERFGAQLVVIGALRDIGPNADAAIPTLIEVVRDPEFDTTLRGDAALALATIAAPADSGYVGPATPEVVAILAEALQQQTIGDEACPYFSWSLLAALGNLGPAARAAEPQVRAATTRADAEIRKDASETLDKIMGTQEPDGQ